MRGKGGAKPQGVTPSLKGGGGTALSLMQEGGDGLKLYTAEAIARVLGLTKEEVRALTESGAIREGYRDRQKLYELDAAAREIIQELKRPEEEKRHVDYTTERARLMQIKRRSEEYDLLVKQRQLFGKEEVQLALSKMLMAFKARLTAIPNRAAPQLAKMKNKAEIMELLSYLIEEALEELSNADDIFEEDG